MTTYYIGSFLIKDKLPLIKLKGNFYSLYSYNTSDKISISKGSLNTSDNKLLLDFASEIRNSNGLGKYTINCGDTKINEILFNQMIKRSKKYYIKTEADFFNSIIYEKVYDKYGKEYAKEMFTGYIFPLIDENDIKFNFSYKIYESFMGEYNLKGIFYPTILNRQNFDRCECFVKSYGVANKNDIDEYTPYISPDKEIRHLYNMNVFDESVIVNNQSQTSINQNNTCNISSNNTNNQIVSAKNSSSISEQQKNTIASKVNLTKPNSITNKIDILNNIKDFILLLPQDDINLLMDMTNSNFNDSNILEYLKMPKEEKIKFLEKKKR